MVHVSFDEQTNVATIAGRTHVFHCHFYNCALQAAIEARLGSDATDVLTRAAIEPVRAQLTDMASNPAETLAIAGELFRTLGFGILDLGSLEATGGIATLVNSHYAMGWIATNGSREEPVCHFPAGFAAGALAAAFGATADAVRVRETECFACGADECRFSLEML